MCVYNYIFIIIGVDFVIPPNFEVEEGEALILMFTYEATGAITTATNCPTSSDAELQFIADTGM